MAEAVKVMVRARPLNTRETEMGAEEVITVVNSRNEVVITHPNESDNVKRFTYDAVFGTDSTQQDVYDTTAFGIVENVIQGSFNL